MMKKKDDTSQPFGVFEHTRAHTNTYFFLFSAISRSFYNEEY